MDIYVSKKNANGGWDAPVNLGSGINTPLNDEAPYLTGDGKTLVFSSQGHNTMGGYDIFYSEMQNDGTWSKPVNIGFPISTIDDGLVYVPLENENSGYISRFTGEGYGNYDLYRVDILPGEPSEEAVTAYDENIPENNQADENILLEKPVEQAKKDIAEEAVKTELPEEPVIEKEAPGDIENIEAKRFNVSGILFEFDSWSLTDKARKKLNIFTEALKEFPLVTAEIIGYADPIGPAEYNKSLSAKRAASVIDYLVNKGISKDRLILTAKGESDFIAKNTNPDGSDNPEGRKYNRRVEFKKR